VTDTPPPGVHRRTPSGSWPSPPVPDADDLAAARAVVAAAHPPTTMIESHPFSDVAGREVHLKLEGASAVRSFKFRGALVAVAWAAEDMPGRAIVTASTGNHGQGVAFAGRRHGLDVIVCSPDTILPEKRAAMEALGATVVVAGATLTESEQRAQEIAAERDAFYLEDGESPHLMAGAATVVMEMLDEQPDLDAIVVPVGGGNLVASSLLAVAAAGSAATVVGVQSVEAPGATMSWLAGTTVHAACHTYAGGLATERPGALSLEVMTAMLGTMVLVGDDDLRETTGWAF
jgi:threonine dehydratase